MKRKKEVEKTITEEGNGKMGNTGTNIEKTGRSSGSSKEKMATRERKEATGEGMKKGRKKW